MDCWCNLTNQPASGEPQDVSSEQETNKQTNKSENVVTRTRPLPYIRKSCLLEHCFFLFFLCQQIFSFLFSLSCPLLSFSNSQLIKEKSEEKKKKSTVN